MPPKHIIQLLLALVLALFAFGFLAALLALCFGTFVLALLAFGFGTLVLTFFGAAGMLLGSAFGLATHGAVALVHAVVITLLGDGGSGVLGSLGGLIVAAASGHGESKCQSGKSGEKDFLHFFDVL